MSRPAPLRVVAVGLSALLLAAAACRARLSREELLHVQAWLLCEDCRSVNRAVG